MIPRQRIALALPEGWLLKDNIARAQWAEEAGYDDLWLADGTAWTGLHSRRFSGAIPNGSHRYVRDPPLLARRCSCGTIGVLEQVFPDRFAMGSALERGDCVGWNGFPSKATDPRARYASRDALHAQGEKSNFDLETLQSHGYTQPALKRPVPSMSQPCGRG